VHFSETTLLVLRAVAIAPLGFSLEAPPLLFEPVSVHVSCIPSHTFLLLAQVLRVLSRVVLSIFFCAALSLCSNSLSCPRSCCVYLFAPRNPVVNPFPGREVKALLLYSVFHDCLAVVSILCG